MSEFLADVRQFLDQTLFTIKGAPISMSTMIGLLIIIIFTFWLSRVLGRLVTRRLAPRHPALASLGVLVRYGTLVIGLGIALDTAGIDLTALFAAGAVFAVAIGFAMQNVVQNFVAGVILLTERTIKPGDVLEIDKLMVRVVDMGIRASIVQSRDGEDLILPNSILIQNTVKNLTLRDPSYNIYALVGVSYEADMAVAKQALLEACGRLDAEWRVPGREPRVVLHEFGNSAVVFRVSVWILDAWSSPLARADLHEKIWQACKERKVTMAYPQLDIHLDEPVVRALDRSAAGP